MCAAYRVSIRQTARLAVIGFALRCFFVLLRVAVFSDFLFVLGGVVIALDGFFVLLRFDAFNEGAQQQLDFLKAGGHVIVCCRHRLFFIAKGLFFILCAFAFFRFGVFHQLTQGIKPASLFALFHRVLPFVFNFQARPASRVVYKRHMVAPDVDLAAHAGADNLKARIITARQLAQAVLNCLNGLRIHNQDIAQHQIAGRAIAAPHVQYDTARKLGPVFRDHIFFRVVDCQGLAFKAGQSSRGENFVGIAVDKHLITVKALNNCGINLFWEVLHGPSAGQSSAKTEQVAFRRLLHVIREFCGGIDTHRQTMRRGTKKRHPETVQGVFACIMVNSFALWRLF